MTSIEGAARTDDGRSYHQRSLPLPQYIGIEVTPGVIVIFNPEHSRRQRQRLHVEQLNHLWVLKQSRGERGMGRREERVSERLFISPSALPLINPHL